MKFRSKAMIWFVPVVVFPIFVFLASGNLTRITLIRRGVAVEGVTTKVDLKDHLIFYEYSFEGELYPTNFKYVGGSDNEPPAVGKKWNITLDPANPTVHLLSDPYEGLVTSLKFVLFAFLAPLTFFVIAAANGFKNPFDRFDREAKDQWKK